jgi:hypothetical protein
MLSAITEATAALLLVADTCATTLLLLRFVSPRDLGLHFQYRLGERRPARQPFRFDAAEGCRWASTRRQIAELAAGRVSSGPLPLAAYPL